MVGLDQALVFLLLLLMLKGNQVVLLFFFLLWFYLYNFTILHHLLFISLYEKNCKFQLQVGKKVDMLVGPQQILLAGGIQDHLQILLTFRSRKVQFQLTRHFLKMPWLVPMMVELLFAVVQCAILIFQTRAAIHL